RGQHPAGEGLLQRLVGVEQQGGEMVGAVQQVLEGQYAAAHQAECAGGPAQRVRRLGERPRSATVSARPRSAPGASSSETSSRAGRLLRSERTRGGSSSRPVLLRDG